MKSTDIDLEQDTRNLIDHYKYWTNEAILADLDSRRHNFSVVCLNFASDLNVGVTIRNANAFLAKEVIIFGRRNYDRRSSVGTQHYTRFKHVREIDDLKEFLDSGDYFVVGLDNVGGALPIADTVWPTDKHTIMIFGQEDIGITEDVLELCDEVRYIPQYGSTRSINVSVASGIAMHEYCKSVHPTKE